MTNCTIARNEQFGSYELQFGGKPSESVRALLKANGYRWHGMRGIWYGYKDITAQLDGATTEQTTTDNAPKQAQKSAKQTRRPSLWERTRRDSLPRYGTENAIKKEIREAANLAGESYDKHVAAYIRKHLRERFPEVKFSVTSGGAGYLYNCEIAIISSPYAQFHIMEDRHGNPDKYGYYKNSDELEAVLKYCDALHDVFDSDDGDHYADYGAHHAIYGDAHIFYKYTQTEQTPEQMEDCADFQRRKAEAEKAEHEAFLKRCEEEKEREKIERAKEEERRKQAEQTAAEIVAHITVKDLDEGEQIAITDLCGGVGKECNLDELRKNAEEQQETADAVISRAVKFENAELFAAFCNMFMRDWDFLRGMGGSASEDVRVKDFSDYQKLTAEQAESVKFYNDKCVAVYLGDVLQLVIDPQGYDYARYVYLPDAEKSLTWTATEYRAALREESETAPAFYCPAPLSEQLETANLKEGETFTALYMDGWTVVARTICGKLQSAKPTTYAQYSDAAKIEYIGKGKRKPDYIIPHTGQDFALYRGELPEIPQNMRFTRVSDLSYMRNDCGLGAHGFIRDCLKYYAERGYNPVIDTIAR